MSCQAIWTLHLCNIVFTWNLYAAQTNKQSKKTKTKNSSMFAFSHYYIMGFITSDFAIIECDVKALSWFCFCLCEPKNINSINKICQTWNIFLLESARGASEKNKTSIKMRSINAQKCCLHPKTYKVLPLLYICIIIKARKRQFHFYWHYPFWIVGMEHKISRNTKKE